MKPAAAASSTKSNGYGSIWPSTPLRGLTSANVGASALVHVDEAPVALDQGGKGHKFVPLCPQAFDHGRERLVRVLGVHVHEDDGAVVGVVQHGVGDGGGGHALPVSGVQVPEHHEREPLLRGHLGGLLVRVAVGRPEERGGPTLPRLSGTIHLGRGRRPPVEERPHVRFETVHSRKLMAGIVGHPRGYRNDQTGGYRGSGRNARVETARCGCRHAGSPAGRGRHRQGPQGTGRKGRHFREAGPGLGESGGPEPG